MKLLILKYTPLNEVNQIFGGKDGLIRDPKNSETSFTVIITSPQNLTWKPLDSDGISIIENDCTTDENGRNYIWTVEVEKPGTYEFRILHQSGDGVYKKLVIPLISAT